MNTSEKDDLATRIKELLGDEKVVRAAMAWLKTIPFSDTDLQGHALGTKGHPFNFFKWPFPQHAYLTDLVRGMKERFAAGLSYPLNLRDAFDCEGHLTCMRCGAYDWDVTDQGIRPLAPCPLRDDLPQTFVDISVPSGKLSVGVHMATYFHGRDKATDLHFDATIFRGWYETELMAQYGFAQMHLWSQAECSLYRTSPTSLILSAARVKGLKPHAEIFPYMPQFAACDAEFFEPLRRNCKHAVRPEVTFETIEVVPGTYRVSMNQTKQPPRMQIGPHRLRPRIVISRIGEATPIPPFEELKVRADAFLMEHPWLLEANMEKRFALRDALSKES